MDNDREISLANLRVPLLAFGGASDGIAPVKCVQPIMDLVPNVERARFEVVPGGHLGMLTGRAARATTWRILDEFLTECASDAKQPTPTPKRAAGAQRSGGPVRAKKAATGKRKASADAIGANPDRRYGSASSRALAARS
jgi:polyhydroxyalkanoate synthase